MHRHYLDCIGKPWMKALNILHVFIPFLKFLILLNKKGRKGHQDKFSNLEIDKKREH